MAKETYNRNKDPENLKSARNDRLIAAPEPVDLVDLWIVIWSYHRIFLWSAMVVFIAGIAYIELLAIQRSVSTLNSVIELKRFAFRGMEIKASDTGTLASRLKLVDLPIYAAMNEFKPIESEIKLTNISHSGRSDLVVISTDTLTSKSDLVAEFHHRLLDDLSRDLSRTANTATTAIRDDLYQVKAKDVRLQAMIKAFDRELEEMSDSEIPPSFVQRNEILARKEALEVEVGLLRQKADNLDSFLNGELFMILTRAEEAVKPVNRIKSYSLFAGLALFSAFFVTMGVTFAAKVRQRMATGS